MEYLLIKILRTKAPFQRLYRIYLRLLAFQLLGGGVIHWARIVEIVEWRGKFYSDMPLNWQIATVYYGVIDLVAGVGVWLLSPWGVVVWITRTLSQFTMHTFFAATYGTRPYELTYYLVTIILFVVLRHYAIKEKKFTLQLGLGLTR